eukprot:TRINITY_DN445_c0_g2_i2.p1 TRINITY_DN445_c0_g2~~TRINITY_DN445_c0_g2_i2.p1  ORF type:complete len:163 (-),score=33.77 TRINITY_DN445_c0_g2_i2:93-581(-)
MYVVGVDFRIKRIPIKDKQVRLEIWDTSGQERYRTIAKNYFDRAMGVIVVYDCADEQSFADVRNWMKQLKNHAREDIVKFLVANKSDLTERKVDAETGQALAKEFGMEFIETSAKLNVNVDKTFYTIAELIFDKGMAVLPGENGSSILRKQEEVRKTKGGCC